METTHATVDALTARAICKRFVTDSGQQITALQNVSCSIPENSFICIIGPSGCGKSTLLRVMAGLERCSSGELFFRGSPQDAPRREIGMVFQEYSLFPWRSVLENICFGPELRRVDMKTRLARGREFLDMVGLAKYEDAKPHELSGGMRQRVAIARALANEPEILLMDEPFGAIDAYTRIRLQKSLLNIWQKHRKTVVFVTHSVDEAVFLADTIIVMSTGPGQILNEIKVALPRPRQRDDPEYAALVGSILRELELAEEVNDES